MMQFYNDIQDKDTKSIIFEIISRNGFTVEHNYYYFLSLATPKVKVVFVHFGEGKGLIALERKGGRWDIVSEIMAPKNERAKLFMEFSSHLFTNTDCRKIYVEFVPELKREILKLQKTLIKDYDTTNLIKDYTKANSSKSSEYAASSIISSTTSSYAPMIIGKNVYIFYCPLCNLRTWDPELKAKELDSLKCTKKKFDNRFKVELIEDKNVLSIPAEDFVKLTHDWREHRKSSDVADYEKYVNFFRKGFLGGERNLAVKVDGKLCAVASGWTVPNTSGKMFYYSVSLHDYSIPGIGDMLAISFFSKLKSDGYEYLDFGGSGTALLNYKKKFQPESCYEIYCFYVRKRKDINNKNQNNKNQDDKNEDDR